MTHPGLSLLLPFHSHGASCLRSKRGGCKGGPQCLGTEQDRTFANHYIHHEPYTGLFPSAFPCLANQQKGGRWWKPPPPMNKCGQEQWRSWGMPCPLLFAEDSSWPLKVREQLKKSTVHNPNAIMDRVGPGTRHSPGIGHTWPHFSVPRNYPNRVPSPGFLMSKKR